MKNIFLIGIIIWLIINLKENTDLVLKKQNDTKRNKKNSKKSLLIIEKNNRQIIKNIKKDKINDQNTKKLFKNENLDIFKNINQNKKIRLNSCENKEYESSSLNNKNKKKPNFQNDDFQKYLKSIGLGDIYKLCMPNTIDNNSIQNFNNRYKPGNKLGNYLPNIFSMNNNKKEKEDNLGKNIIIPNRRLVPLGKKIWLLFFLCYYNYLYFLFLKLLYFL